MRALLAALLLCAASSVALEPAGDGTRWVRELDGAVVAHASTRDAAGRETLWLLLRAAIEPDEEESVGLESFEACGGPAAEPLRLVALTHDGERLELTTRVESWPATLRALETLPLPDGSSTLVAYDGEAIWRLGSEGPIRTLELPDLVAWITALGGDDAANGRYVVSDADGLIELRLDGDALQVARRISLPKSISTFGGRTLWSTGTAMSELLPAANQRHLLYGWPHSSDDRRYAIERVTLPARGEPVVERCWIRTPDPEDVMQQQLLRIDGREIVALLTTRSDKVALLGEKRLRLYQPGPDRTRSGRDPLVALETRANLWQSARLYVSDVDGDGDDDLTLAYWKGRRKRKAVLDTYLGVGGARLASRPVESEIPLGAEDPSTLSFAEDWNGDGHNDWIWLADGAVELHLGREDPRAKQRVETRALSVPIDTAGHRQSWSVSIGGGPPQAGLDAARRLPPLDLDGDGSLEWLYAFGDAESGRSRLTVVRFDF